MSQPMVLSVDALVDCYIHYHQGHAKELIPSAASIFSQKYSEAMSTMREDMKQAQLNAMVESMKAQGKSAESALIFARDLEQGSTLEQIMDNIAAEINQGIERYEDSVGMDNYQTILDGVYGLSSMLSSGAADINSVQQFFTYLHNALLMLGPSGKISLDEFAALVNIGKTLSNGKFNLSSWEDVISVTEKDIMIGSQIINDLSKAATKLQSNGSVTTQSFQGTISNIFNRTIGEYLAKVLLAEGLAQIEQQADKIMDNIVVGSAKSKGIKASWAGGDKPKLVGDSRTSSSVSKVDVVNNDVFRLSTTVGGRDIGIEIATNMSVKWGKSDRKVIQLVSNSTLGQVITDEKEKYLGYNIIAHRLSGEATFTGAYQQTRAGIAASFFNEWLSGTGQALQNATGVDKAQFLMVNGRVYSIMRIVKNICDDVNKNTNAFRMDIKGINTSINKWHGDFETKSLELAKQRSEYVKAVLNTLQIAATLNSNILKKYAY